MANIVAYTLLVVGIVGNILSAIVWLRRRVAGKNSSAIYLASLAINDLVYLLTITFIASVPKCGGQVDWVCLSIFLAVLLHGSSYILEPLLVFRLRMYLDQLLHVASCVLEPLLVLSFSVNV